MNIKIFATVTSISMLLTLANLYGRSNGFDLEQFNDKKGNKFMQSDSSKIKEIVYTEGKGYLAFDKGGAQLFEVFPFDNGPDYPSEGLFRIIENGKIGYADECGNVVIKPQFNAALQFRDGMAAFCEKCFETIDGDHKSWIGGKWGFINRSGIITIPAEYERVIEQFEKGIAKVEYSGSEILINKNGKQLLMSDINYNRWINLLGQSLELKAKIFFGDTITVNPKWLSDDKYIFNSDGYSEFLRVTIGKNEKKDLLKYDVIPWQNFSIRVASEFLISLEELNCVTDYSVIYAQFSPREKFKNDLRLVEKLNKIFQTTFEREKNNISQDADLHYPENVQFISKKIYPNYVDLQVAVPGTILPADSVWAKICEGKMIYLQLVPDISTIKKRWIKTADRPTDTYYTSVEDDLLSCFEEALNAANDSPSNRSEIFETTRVKMRELFSAANSYVNFLYDKYEERLNNWLCIGERARAYHNEEDIFRGYHPKQTPDTILDFRPSLNNDVEQLPTAELNNFPILFRLLKYYQNNSKINQGHWEDGNMVLGAQPREYIPSDDELLASEVGDRLAHVVRNQPKERITALLRKDGISFNDLEYINFTFTHVDVMGSGRFFYVLESKTIKYDLEMER